MSAEQKALADTLVIFTGLFIYIFRIVFAVLLFVLVIKAIKYFNNKNKYNCATCIYKQRYYQDQLDQTPKIISPEDGL